MRASLAVTIVLRGVPAKPHIAWSIARNGEFAITEDLERQMLYAALWQTANEINTSPRVAPIQLEGGGDTALPVEPMTHHERIAQRAANARVVLAAYRATGGQDADDRVAIQDLIGDLLHLHEEISNEEGGNETGEEAAYHALAHFINERDKAIAFPTTIG